MDIVSFFLSRKKFNSVLDVGCGKGQNIKMIRFFSYHGIDIDKKRIKNNKSSNFDNRLFFQHDISKTSFGGDKNYDLVMMIQVLTNRFFNQDLVFKTIDNLCFQLILIFYLILQ